jgi:BCD family chlorophyll transporter-like MFS transporter
VNLNQALVRRWMRVAPHMLPFADAATPELPLGRLVRLSLFQFSVGMALSLLVGTLNRVMIVELHVPALLVGAMLALPLLFAPLRALVGLRSDNHRSALGWRRVPYIWFGTLLQFGGLAIMPFALIVLSGDTHGPLLYGQLGAALAFLLVGAGVHTTQTVGLALATDLAPDESRPRVVALMCSMLLIGMAASSLAYGALLAEFSQKRLIEVVQGTAVVTLLLNVAALWKQEARDAGLTGSARERPGLRESWQRFSAQPRAVRRLVALGIGTLAFGLQDILLEPYGGQVLGLSVSGTTLLSAVLATCGLCGFVVAARVLARESDAYRVASIGTLFGLAGLTAIAFAAPMHAPLLLALGAAGVGFGGGLFAHSTLTAAMQLAPTGQVGLAIGIWGSVQATAAGGALALGGLVRDAVNGIAAGGALGETLATPATGYGAVYQIEILLLFATLVVLGPLVRSAVATDEAVPSRLPAFNTESLEREAVA